MDLEKEFSKMTLEEKIKYVWPVSYGEMREKALKHRIALGLERAKTKEEQSAEIKEKLRARLAAKKIDK